MARRLGGLIVDEAYQSLVHVLRAGPIETGSSIFKDWLSPCLITPVKEADKVFPWLHLGSAFAPCKIMPEVALAIMKPPVQGTPLVASN